MPTDDTTPVPATTAAEGQRSIPIVAFASGKGGCGKTTIAINFANIIAARGRVLLVDLDLNNHGTTGSFSPAVNAETLTATRVIHGDVGGTPVSVKPAILLVPAALPGEAMPDLPSASFELSTLLRERLLELARRFDAVCVVIDCFCGIDVLTTASFGAADHAIIVNEPDLVTFTGSLHLLKHVEAEFSTWSRSPSLHVVINRLRAPYTVKSLSFAYRDNLSKELREAILCHFPYNEKIFRNYGHYPFVSDLIPGSLFVRKLHLLAYTLFKDNHDALLAPPVRKWSERTLKRTYLASVDPAAVDAESLVMRFVMFPVAVPAWAGLAACFIGLGPRTLVLVWSLTVLMAVMGVVLVMATIGRGTWQATRLAWTLGTFRIRLARTVNAGLRRQELRVRAVFNLIASSFMASYWLTLFATVVFGLGYLVDMGPGSEHSLAARQAHIALALPLPKIDLRNLTLAADERYDQLTLTSDETLNGNRVAIVGGSRGTKIENGTLASLERLNLTNVAFDKCKFEATTVTETGHLELRISDSTFTGVELTDPRPTETGSFDLVTVSSSSRLTNTVIRVRGGTTVDLIKAAVKHVTIERVSDSQDKGQTVTVLYDGPAAEVLSKGAVSVNKSAQEGGASAAIGARIAASEQVVDNLERLCATANDVSTEQSFIDATADLAELYIVRGGTGDVDRALSRLDRLGNRPAKDGLDGMVKLVQLLARIRQGDAKEEETAARAWKEWLERGGPSAQGWSWDWMLWSGDIGLNDTQKRLVGLVRETTSLVNGSPSSASDSFLRSFLDVLHPAPSPREPELYVQVASSRDEAGLVHWMRTLNGKYKPEIYQTKSGYYAATLGKHPAHEAEALKTQWLTEFGGQVFLAAGYTYEGRVYPPR